MKGIIVWAEEIKEANGGKFPEVLSENAGDIKRIKQQ
jgi:hypothetical protein